MPSVNDKSRVGTRYLYPNDPVRRACLKAGLYKEIPATDPLLTEFRSHLINDLQMKKGDVATGIVTKVARFVYHFQSLCRPTVDPPIAIDVATLSHRQHCGAYIAKLRSAGVCGAGQKNYVTAVRKFLQFLIASSSLPDEDCKQAQRLLEALNKVRSGVQSAVNKDMGNKNLRHILHPTENTCQLDQVMQAVNSEAISTDVHNAIARAKAISEKRRGGDFSKIAPKEHRLVSRYLGGAIIQLEHCQRPGVCSAMTLDEVVQAIDMGDEMYLVGVLEHKTSTTHPAFIAFNGDQMQMMRDYMKYVRGEMPEDGTPDKSPFFRSQAGKPIKNFSQELNRLQLAYGILLKKSKGGSVTYTAGHARRALEAANKVRNKGDNSRMKAISDYLTHSQDVALKHNARTTTQEVKDARRAMNSLIHGYSSQGPRPLIPML